MTKKTKEKTIEKLLNDVELFEEASPVKELNIKFLQEKDCPDKVINIIKKLNTPEKIQKYIKANFEYNHDDTTKSLIDVIETNSAHCFEGTIGFAFPILYFWGYNPKIVMIQADNLRDPDHNLAVYRIKNKIGAIGMSSHLTLMDRPAIYTNLHDLMSSYYPYYTSDYPEYLGQHIMIGYTDPIDLISKYGIDWIFQKGDFALQDLYDHYTDNLMCTELYGEKRRYSYE